jgi:uncharacterized protein YbjT (DUF2867 family)
MQHKTALIIGSTGLVGQQLTRQLLLDDHYQSIHVFIRRGISLDSYNDPNNKLIQHIVDFDTISDWQFLLSGDDLFCCIGTTITQAGSKLNQSKVDLEIPSEIAQYAHRNGVTKIALVSAANANPKSSSFYLKLKGQLEQNILALDWQQAVITRPSFLDGHRDRFRLGEQLAITLFSFFKYIPWIKNYRPIKGEQVATRMRLLMNSETSEKVIIEELEELFQCDLEN